MKKKIVIMILVLIVSLSIVKLYQTYAISSSITGDNDSYTVNLNGDTSVVVPAGSSKTVYYKIRNTNNGTIRYGIGYKSTTIAVKVYSDSESASTGLINKEENKFIKLYLENNSSSSEMVYLTTVLGYENGGDLVVPSEYGLVKTKYIEPKGMAGKELKRLKLTISEGTPKFNRTSVVDGTNGIYEADDDFGKTYYFRGDVENNYVYFANFYWRIIRINGDGTVRMIYAGTNAHPNGYDDSTTKDTEIGTSVYSNGYNDNTFVGYMNGASGANDYIDTHSNNTDSFIKKTIDNWYKINLLSKEQFIADAIYCNDRSLFSGTGTGGNSTEYSSASRRKNDVPSLMCLNTNDRFTNSINIGNGKLIYPIGLITIDEAAYSGGHMPNNEYYLYTGYSYWTMTPYAFSVNGYDYAYLNYINKDGQLSIFMSHNSASIRPVISLKSGAITGGNGTMNNPFTVG